MLMTKKFFDKFGSITVYLVSEFSMRNKSLSDEEFSNFAIHSDFKEIPKNEIWVSSNVAEDELMFCITNALIRIGKEDHGWSVKKAYDYAMKREKNMRNHNKASNNNITLNEEDHNLLYLESIGVTHQEQFIYIYLVDGEYVRNKFKVDFVEAGHGVVYGFMPQNEIWVDKEVPEEERPIIILHELEERQIMLSEKLPYDDAHYKASKIEWDFRKAIK